MSREFDLHAEIAKERYLDRLAANASREAAAADAIKDADTFILAYRQFLALDAKYERERSAQTVGCKACHGSGGKKIAPCKVCHGTGRVPV